MDIKSPLKEKLKGNYAFIDSQNLNLGVKSMGWELDWGRFRLYIRNRYDIRRAFLFIGYIDENRNLYKELEKLGFTIIFKEVLAIKSRKSIKYKGNVDAELVLHTMIEWTNYDKAMIVSGDGDFYCLVEHLQKNNKLLKIIVPNYKYSSLLKRLGKSILPIPQIKRKVEK